MNAIVPVWWCQRWWRRWRWIDFMTTLFVQPLDWCLHSYRLVDKMQRGRIEHVTRVCWWRRCPPWHRDGCEKRLYCTCICGITDKCISSFYAFKATIICLLSEWTRMCLNDWCWQLLDFVEMWVRQVQRILTAKLIMMMEMTTMVVVYVYPCRWLLWKRRWWWRRHFCGSRLESQGLIKVWCSKLIRNINDFKLIFMKMRVRSKWESFVISVYLRKASSEFYELANIRERLIVHEIDTV